MRRALALAVTLGLGIALAPAHASNTLSASGRAWLYSWSGGWVANLCAQGSVDDGGWTGPGVWVVTFDKVDSGPGLDPPLPVVVSGPVLPLTCFSVNTAWAPEGAAYLHVTFASAATVDPIAVANYLFTWEPVHGPLGVGTTTHDPGVA
jgi:hypothetical protein